VPPASQVVHPTFHNPLFAPAIALNPSPSINLSLDAKAIINTLKWEQHDTVYILHSLDLLGTHKIAGFDMDSTIIKTKSGRKFPTNKDDWEFLFPEVEPKLKQLYTDGYKIVIFTNQGGISKGNQNAKDIQDKIVNISRLLEIPIQAFVATADNIWRKPGTEMWKLMCDKFNSAIVPDLTVSYYVGDAAGRPKSKEKGKDFSASDRKFAANIGMSFNTETEFFLNKPTEQFSWCSFDPNSLNLALDQKYNPADYGIPSSKQEMIIMVGCPGSGKSTFSKKALVPNGYVRINRDTLGTNDRCLLETRAALEKGKSVVIDNTNPSVDSRVQYKRLADQHAIPARCFYMNTSLELAQHLNGYRMKLSRGKIKTVPNVAYSMYKAKFVKPTKAEGYSEEPKEVPWIPLFESAQEKILFKQWT